MALRMPTFARTLGKPVCGHIRALTILRKCPSDAHGRFNSALSASRRAVLLRTLGRPACGCATHTRQAGVRLTRRLTILHGGLWTPPDRPIFSRHPREGGDPATVRWKRPVPPSPPRGQAPAFAGVTVVCAAPKPVEATAIALRRDGEGSAGRWRAADPAPDDPSRRTMDGPRPPHFLPSSPRRRGSGHGALETTGAAQPPAWTGPGLRRGDGGVRRAGAS